LWCEPSKIIPGKKAGSVMDSPPKPLQPRDVQAERGKPVERKAQAKPTVEPGCQSNNNDAWYDRDTFVEALKVYLKSGKTLAFVYENRAYYALHTIAEALNRQRGQYQLDPLQPKDVIEFFKNDRGLDSGKYILRFESGLPTKTYLYSHAYLSGKDNPVHINSPKDDNGRVLKSLKPLGV